MSKAGRVVVGLGIVTLGVCAALPFQRREVAVSEPAVRTTPSTGLNVRGEDVPALTMERMPVLAMESSLGADVARVSPSAREIPRSSSLAGSVKAETAEVIPPELRLDLPTAVPRIAESFSQAGQLQAIAEKSICETLADRSGPPPSTSPAQEGKVADANLTTFGPPTGPVRLGAPVAWAADPNRTLPPTQGPQLAEVPVPVADQSGGGTSPTEGEIRHRIRDGDTLPDLARRYLGDAARAEEIFQTNRQVLSRPDVLPLGQVLRIPAGNAASGG